MRAALLILLVGIGFPAWAQNQWVQTTTAVSQLPTIPGATQMPTRIAVSGNNLVAAMEKGGIYFSSDDGASWVQRSNLMAFSFLTVGTDLFVGTEDPYHGGIYQSSDNGVTWTNITPDSIYSPSSVWALVTDGTAVYAANYGTKPGIYKSSLAGISHSSWTLFNNGLGTLEVQSLLLKGSTIYAGTFGSGVWTSSTSSANWSSSSSGIPPSSDFITSLASLGSTLFAGNVVDTPVLYRSSDNGATWVQSSTNAFGDLAVHAIAAKGDTLFAATDGNGVVMSIDNGVSWSSFSQGFGNCALTVNSLAVKGNTLYAGTNCGVWKRALTNTTPCNPSLLTASPAPIVCPGGSTVLSVSGGSGNYLWSPAASLSSTTGSSITASPAVTTTYTVTDQTLNACSSVLVTVRSSTLSTSAVQSICRGSSAVLNIFSDSTASVLWRPSTGLSDSTLKSVVASPTRTTTYTITATTLHGCTMTGSITLTVDSCVNILHPWVQSATPFPRTGSVMALAAIGSNLFAGLSNGGVYFSSDNGATWIARNGNFNNDQVFSLLAVGTDLYAGTTGNYGGGIYKSSDNALTWTNVAPNGITLGSTIWALVTDGTNLYAANYGGQHGIYKTQLSGVSTTSWTLFNTGLGTTDVRSLFVSNSTLYAGTFGHGVWSSPTSTANWTSISSGILPTSNAIEALGVRGSTLFAGNLIDTPVLYRSTDSGSNWAASSTSVFGDQPVYAILVRGDTIFAGTEGAGVMMSADNGATWNEYNVGFRDVSGNWICGGLMNVYSFATMGSSLYAGTACGVWRSDFTSPKAACNPSLLTVSQAATVCPGGSTVLSVSGGSGNYMWSPATGLSSTTGNSVTAAPAVTTTYTVTDQTLNACSSVLVTVRPTTLSTSAAQSICRGSSALLNVYSDSTASVLWRPSTGLSDSTLKSVVASPTRTTTYTITATRNGCAATGTITLTVDSCVNTPHPWVQSTTSFPPASTIWALAAIGGNLFAGVESGGVYFSSDNGATWVARNGNFNTTLVFSLLPVGTDLYAGTTGPYGGGIYKSSDNALTWTNITPDSIYRASTIWSLVTDGTNLFAANYGGQHGIYKTQLSGVSTTSWSLFNTGLGTIDVRSLFVSNSTLYAGTFGHGVWSSPTSTANWSSISSGILPTSNAIEALGVRGSTLFAGNLIDTPVLYRSTDGGSNWTSSSTSVFGDQPVYAILVRGDTIFAGTEGSGVMMSADNGATWNEYNVGFRDVSGNWICGGLMNVYSFVFVGSYLYAGTACGVWRSDPPPTSNPPCPRSTLSTSGPVTICQGDPTRLSARGGQGSNYRWSPGTGLSATTGATVLANPGSSTRYIVSTDSSGCADTLSVMVTVKTITPPTISMTYVNSVPTLASSVSRGNQWYKDGALISGDTTAVLAVTTPGVYTANVTQGSCVSGPSQSVVATITGLEEGTGTSSSLDLYPNPSDGIITIDCQCFDGQGAVDIAVVDLFGRSRITTSLSPGDLHVDISTLSTGYYILRASQNNKVKFAKFCRR